MFINNLKKQIEKLFKRSSDEYCYTDESVLTQEEIDRIVQIANALLK